MHTGGGEGRPAPSDAGKRTAASKADQEKKDALCKRGREELWSEKWSREDLGAQEASRFLVTCVSEGLRPGEAAAGQEGSQQDVLCEPQRARRGCEGSL